MIMCTQYVLSFDLFHTLRKGQKRTVKVLKRLTELATNTHYYDKGTQGVTAQITFYGSFVNAKEGTSCL